MSHTTMTTEPKPYPKENPNRVLILYPKDIKRRNSQVNLYSFGLTQEEIEGKDRITFIDNEGVKHLKNKLII